MEIYSVGSSDLSEYDFHNVPQDDYVWFVYEYEYGSYEGSGVAVALRKDGLLEYANLGHCSCYGPTDEWGGTIITVENFMSNRDSIHWDDWSKYLRDKVMELLNG